MKSARPILIALTLIASIACTAQPAFVQRSGSGLRLGGKPYYYVGTNYWYGSLLALHPDSARGIGRLRRELDFMQAQGITNLRVLAGAEGSGLVNGVPRVGPPLQPERGVFDDRVLRGLDVLLAEMGKRNMKAVIFFSNNWEWSGGFLQYLRWYNVIPDSTFRRKMSWDELRDVVSKFYTCRPCWQAYAGQVDHVLRHTNTVTGKRYIDDPAIMAWELANEPRPMRPASDSAYATWVRRMAGFIKRKDPRHLLTLGHEGEIGTESMALFEQVHNDPNVDYLTIHIWPKNWGWLRADSLAADYPAAAAKTTAYIDRHVAAARRLHRPLVIEEFGLIRDGFSFDPSAGTRFRDRYYDLVFGHWMRSVASGGPIAGISFWAMNGTARPTKGQVFWKEGDDYMGDPPMEEQGLYGVFDSDRSTWALIQRYARMSKAHKRTRPVKKTKGAATR